jgi:hypothetical protein
MRLRELQQIVQFGIAGILRLGMVDVLSVTLRRCGRSHRHGWRHDVMA